MTTYPNREHEVADKAASRRALAALQHIADEALVLTARIQASGPVDGDDSRRIASLAGDLTQHLAVLGTLRDVREWHAADKAQGDTQ